LTQIWRQTGIELWEIAERFDELDAQTCKAMATLRDADGQCAFIRAYHE
jgi:hypothetical protein